MDCGEVCSRLWDTLVARKPYPSDVSDDEQALVAPCSTLLREGAAQRNCPLREVFNALCHPVRHGVTWRAMPNDLPPWHAVRDQADRWSRAGCFEVLTHDLRAVPRLAASRDGLKRTKGSELHLAADTLGHLLASHATPAVVDDRVAAGVLAAAAGCRALLRLDGALLQART